MSGPEASTGLDMLHGAQLAAARLNAGGGVLGRHVVLVPGDDRADPATGASVARRLVRGRISAVIGPFNSSVGLQALPVYRAAVASGELAPGYAADDGAALLFEGTELAECVSSGVGARVLRVQPDGRGGVVERALAVRLLPGAGEAEGVEAGVVGELRDLRAGGSRWK